MYENKLEYHSLPNLHPVLDYLKPSNLLTPYIVLILGCQHTAQDLNLPRYLKPSIKMAIEFLHEV